MIQKIFMIGEKTLYDNNGLNVSTFCNNQIEA